MGVYGANGNIREVELCNIDYTRKPKSCKMGQNISERQRFRYNMVYQVGNVDSGKLLECGHMTTF